MSSENEMGLENLGNPQPEEKRFTQSELNKFLADDRRKTERKYRDKIKSQQLDHDLERVAYGPDIHSPKMALALLRSMSKVVERTGDDGQGTGDYDTLIELQDLDTDDNPVTTRLSPTQAIKRMRDLSEFQSLFKSNLTPGVGGSGNSQPTRQLDPSKLTTEQYMELRKTNPRKLGLRR